MKNPRIMALRNTPGAVVEAFWRRVDDVIGSGSQQALAVRAAKAEMIVRAYYVYLLVLSFERVGAAINALAKGRAINPRLDLALTSWIPLDAWREVAFGSALLMLAASLLAVAIPRWRIPRIVAVVSVLLLEAMKFDQIGMISHASHPVVWAGIAFCFLPSSKRDSSERCREYLASFFGAQVMVALLYSCSGFSKILGIAYDWHEGVTWLNPEALPLTLSAFRRPNLYYPAAEFFLSNPWASWLSNVGVLYLETGTLFAVFRRRLHRPWALGILAMHVMILLVMRVQFQPSVFIVTLLLLASPFAPTRLELKATLLDLPLVRLTHQWLTARGEEHQRDSSKDAPWMPRSRAMKLWIPVVVVVFLCVAYGTLDKQGGIDKGFDQEIYPISAMPMFMRIDSSEENIEDLARIRAKINKGKKRSAAGKER
jgi:hypothetical protein